jgi:hypothetical protein
VVVDQAVEMVEAVVVEAAVAVLQKFVSSGVQPQIIVENKDGNHEHLRQVKAVAIALAQENNGAVNLAQRCLQVIPHQVEAAAVVAAVVELLTLEQAYLVENGLMQQKNVMMKAVAAVEAENPVPL